MTVSKAWELILEYIKPQEDMLKLLPNDPIAIKALEDLATACDLIEDILYD